MKQQEKKRGKTPKEIYTKTLLPAYLNFAAIKSKSYLRLHIYQVTCSTNSGRKSIFNLSLP